MWELIEMEKEILTDELYEQARRSLMKYTVEEIKEWREQMIKSGKIDEKLLAIFNEIILNKTNEENLSKSK